MAHWTGSLTFSPSQKEALETFIHHPDTRSSDIFDQGTLAVKDQSLRLDWIIKHDLFEGVVIHFSLMADDGSRFLAGDESTLSDAQALCKTYKITYQDQTYEIDVQFVS